LATYDPPTGLTASTTYTRWAKDATCNTTFTQSSGSWVVTIEDKPVITNPGAQTECDSYTLPTIAGTNLSGNQKYYDDSQANSGAEITNLTLTSSQTVWIYDATSNGCSDEESFVVTIELTPVITNPVVQAAANSYTGSFYNAFRYSCKRGGRTDCFRID